MLLSGPIFLFSLIALLAGLASLSEGRAERRRARAVKMAKPVSIAKVRAGQLAAIVGRGEAADGDIVTAPLSEKPVLWYRVSVRRWERAAGRDDYHEVFVKQAPEALVIDDGFGAKARVRLSGAMVVTARRDADVGGKDSERPSERALAFLASHDLPLTYDNGSPRRYLFLEETLEPGSTLLAYGVARSMQGEVELQLEQGGSDEVIVSDRTQDELQERFTSNANSVCLLIGGGAAVALAMLVARQFGY